MSKIVVIHVGANSNIRFGGFRAPIFSNGSFIFMQFPMKEDHRHDPEPPTYEGKGWGAYVPSNILKRRIHLDPNFTTPPTYGHDRRPGDNVIFDLKGGAGYLFFMASLQYNPSKGTDRLPWINPEWGAYLVGWFKVDNVLTQDEFSKAPYNVQQRFRNNPHFTRKDRKPEAHLWIRASQGGILDTAVPLSDPVESRKPNLFTKSVLRTASGNTLSDNTPFYHLVLTCEESLSDFWKEVLEKNPNLTNKVEL
jgi:hypothetical protein